MMPPKKRKISEEARRFGLDIRAARKRVGMSQAQVAAAMNVQQGTVSSWETGARGLASLDQAEKLDRVFGAPGVIARAWTRRHTTSTLPQWYEEVERLEAMMSELREYQPLIVPGLVQTEAYARALLQDTTPLASQGDIAQRVSARVRRQEVLTKDDRPMVSMVLEHEAITRPIGGPSVFGEQLERLLDWMEAGIIRLQVMPKAPSTHPGAAGPFRLYSFPKAETTASAEHMGGERLLDEKMKIQHCATIFGILQAEALSPRVSRDIIRKVRDEIDVEER
jgi:transcriptional regulator with XRE-family HTH domain